MTDLSGRKPILCLDFDGVCHSYVSGWKGAAVIPDPPVEGLWSFILEASEIFEINVYSSRSGQEGGIEAMRKWFIEWGNKYGLMNATVFVDSFINFPTEKPPAFIGIDDRVITFKGVWPEIQTLRNFKTWNAKEV